MDEIKKKMRSKEGVLEDLKNGTKNSKQPRDGARLGVAVGILEALLDIRDILDERLQDLIDKKED